MISADPRALLRRFPPPRAPEALRARVLAGARGAVVSAARPTRADWIWFSSGWRLAWVGAVAALILLETISARQVAGTGRSGLPPVAGVPECAAAAEALGLPTHGWLGDRVVTSGEAGADVMEDAL